MTDGSGAAATLLAAASAAFSDNISGPLGVAVSGGGDSMALLDLLARQSKEAGRRLHAVTVDHGLRPEAASEALFVGDVCRAVGVPHTVLRWSDWDGTGNLQAAARAARYRLIANWATQQGIGAVALAHTLEDNAESFVMGLTRGAGLDGLSGMRPRFRRGAVTFLRPLLGVSREDLRRYLRDRQLDWRDDPTNEDESFDRIRIRNALVAAGVDQAQIAQSVAHLRRSRNAIEAHLARWAGRHVREEAGDLAIDKAAFSDLPDDFARRLLNAGLRWVSGADYPPRAERVLRIVGAFPEEGQTLHGCFLRTEPRGLVIGREPRAAADAPATPTTGVWDGRWRLDGPHAEGLRIRALGADGLSRCGDWRETGLPRTTLLASPAVWQDDALIAAPLAGLPAGWAARTVQSFVHTLAAH